MDLNEIEMYSSHDPFEIDDEVVYDYSFADICSSFDSLEMQFVDGDTEQTVKILHRYFRKRSHSEPSISTCLTLIFPFIV